MTVRRTAVSRRHILQGGSALGIALTLPKQAFAQAGQVNFYNWDTYIGETTLADFEDATGIDVRYSLFADNDELFARLRGGNPGFDVIVPTNDYTERMIVAEMLEPLDHSKIPNMDNIEPTFMDPPFDPGRKYSLPYMWGTIGVGYRESAFGDTPNSWKPALDSDAYANRIALMSEGQSVLQSALKYLGHSLNDWSEDNLREATQLILDQKPHVAAFAPDNGQDLLYAGEVDLAMEWNGDILQVMAEDDDVNYYVPIEGALRWEDTLAIPKGAPNPDNAHALINFLHDAEVNAAIAEHIRYATPNRAAKELLSEEYLNNPALFPPDEVLARTEVSLYPGLETVRRIEDAWTRIKSAS